MILLLALWLTTTPALVLWFWCASPRRETESRSADVIFDDLGVGGF